MTTLSTEQWEQKIQEARVTMFLALEDNKGAHRYLTIENATEEEAYQFTEDAFKYTQYRAVYLFDACCQWCETIGLLVNCDHELEPATHVDYVHHLEDETKEGVEHHE